jgi:Predicted permease YjgP/YjgQ family.
MNNLTLYGTHGRIFVINSYDIKRQQMNNVIISENNEHNQIAQQIVAKKAQWLEGYWVFYDCIVTTYNADGSVNAPEHSDEKVILIDETPIDIQRANIQPDLMSYWQLEKIYPAA